MGDEEYRKKLLDLIQFYAKKKEALLVRKDKPRTTYGKINGEPMFVEDVDPDKKIKGKRKVIKPKGKEIHKENESEPCRE